MYPDHAQAVKEQRCCGDYQRGCSERMKTASLR